MDDNPIVDEGLQLISLRNLCAKATPHDDFQNYY